ncbi:hypothetical protein TNCV_4562821 [Trichonephila clavipes]|uniref:Uncharacterized protein n=1 Tax=Trichonephila clavipes TaxID=2585209 RepID=A0A8X6W499_TRICX|nr:hypothetical protein TNCV_4562821 [Trichonephila clavipes]
MEAAKYIEILIRFMKRLRRVRPQYVKQGLWYFVRGNVPPHSANIIKQFLAKKEVVQIEHTPFNNRSSYLNPPAFFLFKRLKLVLKGRRFDGISDIQRSVTKLLNSIPK